MISIIKPFIFSYGTDIFKDQYYLPTSGITAGVYKYCLNAYFEKLNLHEELIEPKVCKKQ